MEIATNAVLLATLMQVSEFVEKLELPLPTPLDATNVRVFRVRPHLGPEDSRYLSSYLVYEGGYEFWHDHGRIGSFCTTNSYLVNPFPATRLFGEVRYGEAECLAKAKAAIEKLGYTNVSLLDLSPKITPPIAWKGKTVPRYIFEWTRAGEEEGEPPSVAATVEVNANNLAIEKLYLPAPIF